MYHHLLEIGYKNLYGLLQVWFYIWPFLLLCGFRQVIRHSKSFAFIMNF